MSLTSIDRINDVVKSVQTARCTQERDMYTEYERSSKWLSDVAIMIKRKMMESCSLERAVKKLKLTKISEEDEVKENSSPNHKAASNSGGNEKGFQHQKQSTNELNEHISLLNVADLRSELRSRGLVTYGLKRDLQERLFEALRGRKNSDHVEIIEIMDDDQSMSQNGPTISSNISMDDFAKTHIGFAPSAEHKPASFQPIQEQSIDAPVDRKDTVKISTDVPIQTLKEVNMSKEDNDELMTDTAKSLDPMEERPFASTSSMPEDIILDSKLSDDRENSLQSPSKMTLSGKLFKATSKLFSPTKTKTFSKDITSPDLSVKSCDMKVEKVSDVKWAQAETGRIPIANHSTKDANTLMDIEGDEQNPTTTTNSDMLKSIGKTPETLYSTKTDSTHSQSVHSSVSDVSGTSSQSSLVMEKSKALAEARKARLAEMREKTKAAAVVPQISKVDNKVASTPVISSAPAVAAANARPQPTQDANEERKKALAAQMREKAAAAARKLAEENAKAAAMEEVPATSKKTGSSSMKSPPTYPRDLLEASAKKKLQKQQMALSPMDTYDMSDREESTSDEDEDDGRKEDKRIPNWAQKNNLIPALERQFLDGPDRADPDIIFPEVSTCDLEAIFDQTKARYVKRTSSGNWTKDRVTASETLVYKRTMGFK